MTETTPVLKAVKSLVENFTCSEEEKKNILQSIENAKPQEFVTIKEAAKRLHTSSQTVRRWIKEGKIKSYNIGRKYLLDYSELHK